ncbi:cysteine-rich with EGF-like domain protein 2 [Pieris brassicae]|uniref:cysteine-rich with EGF-like domain protein 2 n=1 Tax=Pieris brassicae TaxID=7116 RepID=UPI001E6615AC|nr:cysteine-rich with EGF-like domain protein 2 [Pieris brassicae]
MYKKPFYICLFIEFLLLLTTASAKNNQNQVRLQKLNDCRRCQIFSDSFIHWFEKTSRGKFDGGDVAWEETKLKSYAQSEIRLVEIQENLCSELSRHMDECYSVAEEAEYLVETWWSEGNYQISEFYSWLCLENLKSCCPKHHYGADCTPCPLDKDGNICSNQGTCHGDSTRKGNGTCICDAAFTGQFCNHCASNYYRTKETECMPCHKSCQECYSYGSNMCKVCAVGWELITDSCTDIDECQLDTVCKNNQYCINSEGSFSCKYCDASCFTCIGSGSYNCTACRPNEELWSGKCIDKKMVNNLLLNADKRLFMYSFLNILMFLFYRRTKTLAIGISVLVSILIFKLETGADITIKDSITNHIVTWL